MSKKRLIIECEQAPIVGAADLNVHYGTLLGHDGFLWRIISITPAGEQGGEPPVEQYAKKASDLVGDDLLHPVSQVYFRAGLLACREYMARFLDATNPTIAMSIRANWWPRLGQDFGPPRKLDWNEVTEGEYETAEFRCKTAEEVSPTQEALPIALGFLEALLAK